MICPKLLHLKPTPDLILKLPVAGLRTTPECRDSALISYKQISRLLILKKKLLKGDRNGHVNTNGDESLQMKRLNLQE